MPLPAGDAATPAIAPFPDEGIATGFQLCPLSLLRQRGLLRRRREAEPPARSHRGRARTPQAVSLHSLTRFSVASDRRADRRLRRPLWRCPSSLLLFLWLRRRALLPVARAAVSHHVAVMVHHLTHLLHHLAHLLHHALHPLLASLHHAAASHHAAIISLHHSTLA